MDCGNPSSREAISPTGKQGTRLTEIWGAADGVTPQTWVSGDLIQVEVHGHGLPIAAVRHWSQHDGNGRSRCDKAAPSMAPSARAHFKHDIKSKETR